MSGRQKGFIDHTLIAAIVFVLIIGGFVILRISQDDSNDASSDTSTSESAAAEQQEADETEESDATQQDESGEEAEDTAVDFPEQPAPDEQAQSGNTGNNAGSDFNFSTDAADFIIMNNGERPFGLSEKVDDLRMIIFYPNDFAAILEGDFDGSGLYQYYNFLGADDFVIGAPEPGYTTPGRGGTLTDFTGFETVSPGEFNLLGLDGSANPAGPGYSAIENPTADGIVNYNVELFGQTFYHAVFQSYGATTAINLAVPTDSIDQAAFTQILQHIEIFTQ